MAGRPLAIHPPWSLVVLSQISVHPLKKGDAPAQFHPSLADVAAVAAGTIIREPPLNVNIPGETAAFLLGQVLGLWGFFQIPPWAEVMETKTRNFPC